jgi:hypothetical protein
VAGAEDCVVTSYFMDSRQFLYLRLREERGLELDRWERRDRRKRGEYAGD